VDESEEQIVEGQFPPRFFMVKKERGIPGAGKEMRRRKKVRVKKKARGREHHQPSERLRKDKCHVPKGDSKVEKKLK